MTFFIVGLIVGIFTGAFIANKTFRERVIKELKKLGQQEPAKKKKGGK